MGSSQFKRWIGGALIWVLALVVMLTHPAFAQVQSITAQGNAANKLKLADRQRLLTEQMGRSVCLVMGGIDPGAESDKARGSADLFHTTMRALRTGDENMAILPEEDPGVLTALDAVAPIFATYRAATLQVGAGDLHSVPVSQVMLLSDPLLEMSNALVERVRAAHGSKANRQLSDTVELARRQTMLSQKLTKEICFAALNIDRPRMQRRLKETLQAFETAQAALERGNMARGILKPTPAMARKLKAVRVLWTPLAEIADQVAAGGDLDHEALEDMIALSNRLLFKTKQAARSYAKL
ncbi:type IV pili methyl-accepting chemotaxis transducer N-terminal domain-containing protein [Sulfitobacter sp. S0837]|uniref:type IV pili methyl-accepting chemotaxis transducer N-terminal domain-containing protein n=1 Tax=Sulfitobacter maritimus TaxID=2741719 RepID=UPI00158387AC|nr:type IV pili methyl-accepting chemotaxis transducer N-terminal domain-containing protein [Sulfitobacter maritimus]NUH64602.1 type IV pili methyl-accepting chemotaxis transducer N-terminal domain-containing protein [Sulfitobacter maritimus]